MVSDCYRQYHCLIIVFTADDTSEDTIGGSKPEQDENDEVYIYMQFMHYAIYQNTLTIAASLL